MFPFNNPEFQLELAREHAADLRRKVAAARLGRSGSSVGRHARPDRQARAPHHAPAAAAG